MDPSTGRVSEHALKVGIGVFFGIAIVAAACRMAIRLWNRMRLRADDYLLLCASAFLIASTGVLYYDIPAIVLEIELALDPIAVANQGISEEYIMHELRIGSIFDRTYLLLSWISVYLVKYGFLALFKNLVDRLPRPYRLWKGVVVFTTLTFAFTICSEFISCPKFGLAAAQCTLTSKARKKVLAIAILIILLDIFADILILAIPVWLLWKVRIKLSQKLGLAAFLCLSICMILAALTRSAGVHYRGNFDIIWGALWQLIEACIAVTMLSLTAFRSLFVEAKPSSNRASPWVPSTSRLLARRKKSKPSEECLDDLSIPSAALTRGSRTINREEAAHSFYGNSESDTVPLSSKIRQESWPDV